MDIKAQRHVVRQEQPIKKTLVIPIKLFPAVLPRSNVFLCYTGFYIACRNLTESLPSPEEIHEFTVQMTENEVG